MSGGGVLAAIGLGNTIGNYIEDLGADEFGAPSKFSTGINTILNPIGNQISNLTSTQTNSKEKWLSGLGLIIPGFNQLAQDSINERLKRWDVNTRLTPFSNDKLDNIGRKSGSLMGNYANYSREKNKDTMAYYNRRNQNRNDVSAGVQIVASLGSSLLGTGKSGSKTTDTQGLPFQQTAPGYGSTVNLTGPTQSSISPMTSLPAYKTPSLSTTLPKINNISLYKQPVKEQSFLSKVYNNVTNPAGDPNITGIERGIQGLDFIKRAYETININNNKFSPKTPEVATFDENEDRQINRDMGMNVLKDGGENMGDTKKVIAGEAGKEWLIDTRTGKIIRELDRGAERIDMPEGSAVVNSDQMSRLQAGEPLEKVLASLPDVKDNDMAQEGRKNSVTAGQVAVQHDIDNNFGGDKNAYYNWIRKKNNVEKNPKKYSLADLKKIDWGKYGNEELPENWWDKALRGGVPRNYGRPPSTLGYPTKQSSIGNIQTSIKQPDLVVGQPEVSPELEIPNTNQTITKVIPIEYSPSVSLTHQPALQLNQESALWKPRTGSGSTKTTTPPPPKEKWYNKIGKNIGSEELELAANVFDSINVLTQKSPERLVVPRVPLEEPMYASAERINPDTQRNDRATNSLISYMKQTGNTSGLQALPAQVLNANNEMSMRIAQANAQLGNETRARNTQTANAFTELRAKMDADTIAKQTELDLRQQMIDQEQKNEKKKALPSLFASAAKYKDIKEIRKYNRQMRELEKQRMMLNVASTNARNIPVP